MTNTRNSLRTRNLDIRGHWKRFGLCQLWLLLICLGIISGPIGCALPVSVQGLKPEYPSARRNILSSKAPSFVEVNSLQPTLRWESFPREADRENDSKGLLARISDVTYDVRIWLTEEESSSEESPHRLVYDRKHLSTPAHHIEVQLAPSSLYFWSVRARFRLEGHPRVTAWSRMELPFGVVGLLTAPPLSFYAFRTPASK